MRKSNIPVIEKEVKPVEHLTQNPYRRYIDYKLNSALSIPSMVHSQSLLTEYIENFILSNFNKNFFKTVYINGRNVMVDYMRRSKLSKIKVEKPALAITPIPNREYDRDLLDSYMGGIDSLIGNFNFEKAFFKDYENNIFLGFNIKEIETAFECKIRVATRAQQEDLYESMRLRFRIGYTHKDTISCDFHIPYELIINIAHSANFEVTNQNQVKDIMSFLSYLNQHSEYPIVYKMRAINGNNEFFMRVHNIYTWIDTRNPLSADDGEREGKLYTNFHIDMNIIARMYVPHFFVFKTASKIIEDIPTTNNSFGIGLYSLIYVELPDINDQGWNKEISTTYVVDEISDSPLTIDMSELFNNNTLKPIIDYTKRISISPSIFIDIICTNGAEFIRGKMNWKTMEFTLDKPIDYLETHIGIYINKDYVNSQISVIENINNTRLQ